MHFVKSPRSGFCSLYFRVSKITGYGLASSEAAGPCEVLVLVPS
jgi:hypothetical protein